MNVLMLNFNTIFIVEVIWFISTGIEHEMCY
jgi:hypothetical protein